jgi:2-(1,2-epoxy-1,2-dihydrophenyl)acetyl-CoA isomerase
MKWEPARLGMKRLTEAVMDAVIRTERRAGWRLITLYRPDNLNAFDGAMHQSFAAALAEAAADPACRAVLLTGAGRGFCAGQELGPAVMPTAAGPPDLAPVVEQYNAMIRRVRALEMPVICAVNGVAAGAGANLALACDIVLAARSAKFIQAFSRIGLVPDSGGTFFLPRLVGEARARALAMLAEPVSAEQAENWGMIWKAMADEELMPAAEAMAAHLATQPTQALRLMKRAFAASAGNTLDAQLDLERDLQQEAARGPDYAEGVKAFLEKRVPVFSGRRQ